MIQQIGDQDSRNRNWNNRLVTGFEKSQLKQQFDNDSSKGRTNTPKDFLEVQIDKYYSLIEDCMLEFLKQQEILRKQEREKKMRTNVGKTKKNLGTNIKKT